MNLKMTGLAVLAATALAAGCGGDDEEPLSKAEYVKQGNKICSTFEEEVGKDAEKAFAGMQSEKDLTPDKAREFFDAALPKFNDAVNELDELAPPEGDEDTVQAIIEAGKTDAQKIEDAKEDDDAVIAFVVEDSATPEFDEKARAYGLDSCGG